MLLKRAIVTNDRIKNNIFFILFPFSCGYGFYTSFSARFLTMNI